MDNSWLKLYRSLLDSDISDDALKLGVWIKLMLLAQYKPKKIIHEGNQVVLNPGQFQVKVDRLSDAISVPRTTLRRILNYFEKTGRIRTQSGHKSTIVTICNWCEYQPTTEVGGHKAADQRPASGQQAASKRPASGQPIPKTTTDFAGVTDPIESRMVERENVEESIELRNAREADQAERASPTDSLRSPAPLENESTSDQQNTGHNRVTGGIADQDTPDQSNASDRRFSHCPENEQKRAAPPHTCSENEHEDDTPPTIDVCVNDEQTTKPKSKKSKRKSSTKKKVTAEPEDRALAIKWADWTNHNWPHVKTDVARWSEAIAKTKRVVGLNHEQMEAVFDFAKKDDFWEDKIQSPVGLLRKGRNDLRKVDNILNQIKKKHMPYMKAMAWAEAKDRGEPASQEFSF